MRIIGGTYRGRKLRVPKGKTARPTLDRVREAIFNLPLVRARGEAVLDLYAGTGALGLEALSRGAETVCFVEADHRVAKVLGENIAQVDAPRGATRVIVAPVEKTLGKRGTKIRAGRYGLILADPPYGLGLGEALLEMLGPEGGSPMPAEGLLLIETERGALPFEARHGFDCVFRRSYGDCDVTAWRPHVAECSRARERSLDPNTGEPT